MNAVQELNKLGGARVILRCGMSANKIRNEFEICVKNAASVIEKLLEDVGICVALILLNTRAPSFNTRIF
jgi:hypothetical protein